jgi:hypothetical protein
MPFRLILATCLFLTLSGCFGRGAETDQRPPIEAQPEVAEDVFKAFFCDETPRFMWTDEEWEFRRDTPIMQPNLRRELQINQRRDAWCPE